MSSKKKSSKKKPTSRRKSSRSDPQTMEDILAQFGTDEPAIGLSMGDKVKGKIVKIEPGRVIIDIGGKSEGLVAEKAYKQAEDFIKTLKKGDKVETVVLVPETQEGFTILSLRQAAEAATWEKVEKAYDKSETVKVGGVSVNPSGVTVQFGSLSGFVPMSQIGKVTSKKVQALVGKRFEVMVIDFDQSAKKVIFSEKEVSEKEELARARGAMKSIKEGDEFEGVVTTIYDFGCFVKVDAPIGAGKKEKVPLEGLVHISELSWDKVDNPANVVTEGDKVKVKVIGKRNGKLAFSIKQTEKDPWESVSKKYKKDKKVKGEVMKVSDFGTFVQLEPGVEGLIHITKIPPGKKLNKGDKVDVYVEGVDAKEKRISLGLVLTEKPVGYK